MSENKNKFIVNRGEETEDYTRVNENKDTLFFVHWINLSNELNPFFDREKFSINQNELVKELKQKYFSQITFGKWLKEGEKLLFLNLTKEHLDYIYFKPKIKIKISFGGAGKNAYKRIVYGHYSFNLNLINLTHKRRPDKEGYNISKLRNNENAIFKIYAELFKNLSGFGSLYHELGHYLDLKEYKFYKQNENSFNEYKKFFIENYKNDLIKEIEKKIKKELPEYEKINIFKELNSFFEYATKPEEIIARSFEIILKDLYLKNKNIPLKESKKIYSGSNYDTIKDNNELQFKYLYSELKNFNFFSMIKNNL